MAYVYLALAGLGALVYTLVTTEDKARVLATFTVAATAIISADWIAFGWFHLYAYAPHLLASREANEALGEFLADIVFVPSLSVYLFRHTPGAPGILLGTTTVTLLELLFVERGLFTHQGWSAWLTAAGFSIYLLVVNRFWKHTTRVDLTHGLPANLVRLCFAANAVAVLSLYLRANGYVETNLHVLPTYVGNQSLGRFLAYGLVTVPIGYWVAKSHGLLRHVRLGLAALALLGFNWFLTAVGWQYFIAPWNGLIDALAQAVAIYVGSVAGDGCFWLARREARWRPPD